MNCANPICTNTIDQQESVSRQIDHRSTLEFCSKECADKLWMSKDMLVECMYDHDEKKALLCELGGINNINENDDIWVQRHHDVNGAETGAIRHVYVRCGFQSFIQIR